MNYNILSQEEAALILFAFKRVLRDEHQLTPTMVQFYKHSVTKLKEKLLKLEAEKKDERPFGHRQRDRKMQIPAVWPDN